MTSVLGAAILGDLVLGGLDDPGGGGGGSIVSRSIEQTLDFLENQEGTGLANLVEDVMVFVEEATGDTDTFPRFIEQTLALVDAASGYGPIPAVVSQSLSLQQQATGTLPIVSKSVTQILALSQTVGRAIPKSAADTLTLTDAGEVKYIGEDTLTLIQSIEFGKGNTHSDAMSLVSLASPAGSTFNRTFSQTLGLRDAATYYVDGLNVSCQYFPFVGSSSDPNAPPPPSVTLQGPNDDVTEPFQLFFPVVDPTDYVTLRAPDLGNRDKLAMNRINRRTRGGTLVIYADPNWPKTQTLELSFSVLHAEEAQALLTFLQEHLGQELGLIDWEKRYWQGVVTDVTNVVTQNGHDDYSAAFTFEGELSEENPPIFTSDFVCSGESRAAQNKGHNAPCSCTGGGGSSGGGGGVEPYVAETDSATEIGSPLYVKNTGNVDLADADSLTTAQVVGFALEAVASGEVEYASEGQIERDDWTDIAGTATLSVGSTYFLSATAGRITTTAPSTLGQAVVRVGRAVSATTLDIEIEAPIKL